MSDTKVKQKRLALARMLVYVLGNRPDEFGLFTDEEGWTPLKDLLQALGEEDGWRFVKESTIHDLEREPDLPKFEFRDKMIRVSPGDSLLNYGVMDAAPAPKLLYYAARQKAYPAILEKGLTPTGGRPFMPLAVSAEMALRIGRRRDPKPVLLTIHAEKAERRGIVFYRPQELIYLAEKLEPDMFTGPPLPKEKPEEEKKKKKPAAPAAPATPGSFFPDPEQVRHPDDYREKIKKKKRSDVPDWKRDVRKDRRRKDKS